MRLDIGNAIGQSFRVLFANLLPFLALCGLVTLPVLLIQLYLLQVDPMDGDHLFLEFLLAISPLLGLVATGAVTYGVFQSLRGKPVSFADCLTTGLLRLFPVLGVSILTGLVVMGGLILFIIPGIIAYLMLYVAVPAAVVEQPGVMGALKRSRSLTEGSRWAVFGVVFLIGIISFAISYVLSLAFMTFTGLTFVLVQWVVQAFTTALAACSMTIVYYQLRSGKEQIDVDEIAAAFS
jgi:hypothetical protein